MGGDVFLPFVEPIAGDAEFPRDLGGRALAGIEKLHRLSFKLGRESSSFCHLTPPWGRIVPPFEVSVKPGLAQIASAAISAPPWSAQNHVLKVVSISRGAG